MYADIVASMELTRLLDAERWGFVLDRFLAIAASAVHAFDGTVNQFTGDGLLAVFGAPLGHEDHARRACLAVLELQREVAALAADVARSDGRTFAIRCGLNSGEVIVGSIGDDVHMDFVPIGNTTALGKRIEALAPTGSAAISASTAALVEGEFELRELGDFELKGADGRQRVVELVGPGSAHTRLEAVAATRGLSRFVGRDAERAALESALESALAGDGRAVWIVGEAGIGKTRLVREFVADCAARGVRVTAAAAVAHGRYVPLLPVLALYRDYFGIGELDVPAVARERIATKMLSLDPAFAGELPLLFEFLGVPDPDRPPEPVNARERQRLLLALVARTVKARSRHEAAVLVLEDLHWIDDASGVFVDALAAAVAGTRTLLVGTCRPEHDAAWARAEPHVQHSLGPLDADRATELLTQLLGRDESLDGLETMIRARAGGNPFFIEEIVGALADSGHLAGARGAYRLASELQGVVLPATVQAGIAARIDRLPAREKALLQTMSVIGNEIPGPLLSEVSDLESRQLGEAIDVLARAQWVVAVDGAGAGGREYVFKHPLTQEVAYGSQLSERRGRAHRAVAAAIERTYRDRLGERAALLAHHREAAGDKLEAAEWHARAAAWAERTSLDDSRRHWRRVRHLASELDASPERDALATKARFGVLNMAWRLGVSAEDTAEIGAEAGGGPGQVRMDLVAAGTLMHSGREREGLEAFRRVSRRVIAAGDPGDVLTASLGVSYASWIAGSLREGVATIDRALAIAGDDPKTGSGVAFLCPLAHALGDRAQQLGYMGEIEKARAESAAAIALAGEQADAETESAAHASRAQVEAEVGDVEAAVAHAALAVAIAERAGNLVHAIAGSTPAAVADARAGRFAEALARAESNLATIREHRVGLYYEPVLLATIARSQLGLGEPGDALAAAEEAVEIMKVRRLATCALSAPIALAQVLIATQGAAARDRIMPVLARAMRVARASGAGAFEPQIRGELAGLMVRADPRC